MRAFLEAHGELVTVLALASVLISLTVASLDESKKALRKKLSIVLVILGGLSTVYSYLLTTAKDRADKEKKEQEGLARQQQVDAQKQQASAQKEQALAQKQQSDAIALGLQLSRSLGKEQARSIRLQTDLSDQATHIQDLQVEETASRMGKDTVPCVGRHTIRQTDSADDSGLYIEAIGPHALTGVEVDVFGRGDGALFHSNVGTVPASPAGKLILGKRIDRDYLFVKILTQNGTWVASLTRTRTGGRVQNHRDIGADIHPPLTEVEKRAVALCDARDEN